ncbi:MAG: hypothetical protein WC865_14330 [Bacteroidales bacterium]
MKNSILIILLVLAGCETEVNVLCPAFQTTPIIYGIIDPFDSVQSVGIQRSFLIRDVSIQRQTIGFQSGKWMYCLV